MSESSRTTSPASKNMRKGTRSCFECRHRKIRCVFRPNNPSTCISCFSHGIRCVSQAEAESDPPSNTRLNLSERVAQLEQELASIRANAEVPTDTKAHPANEMKRMNGALPTVSVSTSTLEISFPISVSQSPAEGLPILSLFDNAILTSDGMNVVNDSIYREFNTGSLRLAGFESSPHFRKSRIKRAKACEALTDLLPTHTAMYEILETGAIWWDTVRRLHPYMCCDDAKMTLQSYVFLALNQDNPSVIGCALSWLALSLQCLPLDFESNHLGLPLPVNDLTQHYLSNVDRLIVSDDELSMSLEGIECILLHAQFHSNGGRPRKGWTTIRRGLSHAVLLGLHRPPLQPPSTSSCHAKRREAVWWHLVECDSYLSLLLGLPSIMIPTLLDLGDPNTIGTDLLSNGYYRRKLAVLVNTISQRNQAIPTSLASLLSATMQIDRELEGLASLLPSSWWQPLELSDQSTMDAWEFHERETTQFWHHQAKAYLHLPFMLQSPTDTRFDCNRAQCLISSRRMIQVYIGMRERAGGRAYLCLVVDFQAFTAAVILIFGLLGYRPTSPLQDTSPEEEDWNMIYRVIEVLYNATSNPDNMIAAQSLRALETLIPIAQGHFPAEENSTGRKIFIPYFGMIIITPGSEYTTANMTMPQRSTQGPTTSTEELANPLRGMGQIQTPIIEIDVFNAPFLGNFVQNLHQIPPSAEHDELSAPDAFGMDIDQDWSWMLNPNYQMD